MKTTPTPRPEAKNSKDASQAGRADPQSAWLFAHWQAWVRLIQRNPNRDIHVPSLDWRSCIAIDQVRSKYVLLSVATATRQPRGKLSDLNECFFFTWTQAKRIFDRYLRLRQRFLNSARPAKEQPLHLKPETWTRRPCADWRCPVQAGDLALFIVSLIAYWDACLAKPPMPRGWTGRTERQTTVAEVWADHPTPKLMTADSLPPDLRARVHRHLKTKVSHSLGEVDTS